MIGLRYALYPNDINFDFVDNLPFESEEFEGLLRWHCELSSNSTGPLFSFHSGEFNEDGSPIFNFVSRRGTTRLVIFHVRHDFKTKWAMLVFLSAMYRVTLAFDSRLVMVGVRSHASSNGLPAGPATKLYGEFGALVHTTNIFFVSSKDNESDKTLINSIAWHLGKAELPLELISVPTVECCEMYLSSVDLACGNDDRWQHGADVVAYVKKFRSALIRWLYSSDVSGDIDILCPMPPVKEVDLFESEDFLDIEVDSDRPLTSPRNYMSLPRECSKGSKGSSTLDAIEEE